jgi:hypothetical protein
VLRARNGSLRKEHIALVDVEVVDSDGASSGVYPVIVEVPFTPPGVMEALARMHGLGFSTPWRLGYRTQYRNYFFKKHVAWEKSRFDDGEPGELKSLVVFVSSVPPQFSPEADARRASVARYLKDRASLSSDCGESSTVLILTHSVYEPLKDSSRGRKSSPLGGPPAVLAVPSRFAESLAGKSRLGASGREVVPEERLAANALIASHVAALVGGGQLRTLAPDIVIDEHRGAPPGCMYGWCIWAPGSLAVEEARRLSEPPDSANAARPTPLLDAPLDEDSKIICELLEGSGFRGRVSPPSRRRFALAFRLSQLGPVSCSLGITVYTPWKFGRHPSMDPAFLSKQGECLETPLLVRIAEKCGSAERDASEDKEMSGYRRVQLKVQSVLEAMQRPTVSDADKQRASRYKRGEIDARADARVLQKYQQEALAFMIEREAVGGSVWNSMWTRIPLPFQHPGAPDRPEAIFWSRVLSVASYDPPEEGYWGGMLCDDVGLGHDTVFAELIARDRPPPAVARYPRSISGSNLVASKATLVVCRVDIMGQWRDRVIAADPRCRVGFYHGTGRLRLDAEHVAFAYDVVITTYDTVSKDWVYQFEHGARENGARENGAREEGTRENGARENGQRPLFKVCFHRAIFDEGHCLANRGWTRCKACSAIEAPRRWIRTSKPLSKSVGELAGLFGALRASRYFSSPGSYGSRELSSEFWPRLLWFVKRLCLRRTASAVKGPPARFGSVAKVAVGLDRDETALYSSAAREAARGFAALVEEERGGGASANELAIGRLTLPLRRICSGGVLTRRDMLVPEAHAARKRRYEEAVETAGLVPPLESPCPICLGGLSNPAVTECGHWFCKSCISRCIASEKSGAACPMCRQRVTFGRLRVPAAAKAAVCPEARYAFDSKVAAAARRIRSGAAGDCSAKYVVFTEFRASAQRLRELLSEAPRVAHVSLDGHASSKARSKAVAYFNADPSATVLFASYRTNIAELDLTAANHVFFLEPPLDPADRDRAIGTVLRHGQKRPVNVTYLYAKNTIEERLLDVWRDREATGRDARLAGSLFAPEELVRLFG